MKYYDDLLNAIDYYMEDKDLNNAFFINGKWGSGKSYFVKNILTQHICKKYDHKIIYISLYGVTSVDEIAKQIYSKLIAEKRIKQHGAKNQLRTKKFITEYAKDTAIATAKNLIPMLLSKVYITLPKIENYWKYITLQNIILVFDDLERSRIDIIELMGYINNFVEEYSIKTIVVGNEDEVKQRFFIDELIEKIEAVKDLKLPIIDDKEKNQYRSILFKESDIVEKKEDGFISTNLNTLSKKVEYLFSSYEKYDKIKEKLIGYTFEFAPPIGDIFSNLSEDEIITRNLNFIEKIYNERNCTNVRTFIFSKHAFMKIKENVKKLELKNLDEILDVIVENIFYCSLEIKNPVDKVNENPYRTITSLKESVPQSVVNDLNEIMNDYLNTLELDFDHFASRLFEFDRIITEYVLEIKNSLKKLQTYWLDKNDDYIQSSLKEIIEMLNQNTLNIQSYPTLISYVYLYNDIFKPATINLIDIINVMIKNIRASDNKIGQDFGVNLNISYWPEKKDEMSHNLEVLHDEIEKHNLSITDQSINSYLEKENWSSEFFENLRDEKKAWRFTSDKNFVSLINVDKLADLIISGSPIDLSNVHQTFKYVYSFSNLNEFFQNDLVNLKKLTDKLKDGISEVKSKVLVYAINNFLSYLNDKISMIDRSSSTQ